MVNKSLVLLLLAVFCCGQSTPSGVCEEDQRYKNLLFEAEPFSKGDSTVCIRDLSDKTIFLWFVGCPPCIFEFREVVFPAAARDPLLQSRLLTGFVVDSGSDMWTELAAQTLRGLPGYEKVRHLVIEKDQGEIGRIVGQLYRNGFREKYPSFLHFSGDQPRFIQVDDHEAICQFTGSDQYIGAVDEVLVLQSGIEEMVK